MPRNILFINPPSMPYHHVAMSLEKNVVDITNFVKQPIAMPMGILYLASVLERDIPDVNIRILDYAKALRETLSGPSHKYSGIDEFLDDVLASQIPQDFTPEFVGLSILFSTAHRTAGFIADAIKRRWPDAPIVVGGMHATNAVPSLLAMPSIDYVCRGEAESVITELVKRLGNNEEVESIGGIHGRKKLAEVEASGGTKCVESCALIDDLDEIPLPAWHLIPMEEYVHSVGSRVAKVSDAIEHDREATIVTTRGCPFSCTFCSSWTVHGRKMRFRSVGNVIRELEILHLKYGVNMVVPEDDLFTVKKPRIIELCNSVADRFQGAIHFQFPNGLSVSTLDRDVIEAMKRMGMSLCNVAIESGSAYVQKHIIKKNCDLDRARRVVQECRDAGVLVRTYFICGFPGETKEMINETFEFAASIATDWSQFGIAAPLIGTEMYDQMLERGDIDKDFNWDTAFFRERTFDTDEISADELKHMVTSANIRINYFGNYNLKIGNYDHALQFYNQVLDGHPGHLAAQYCIGMVYKLQGDDRAYNEVLEKCREQLRTSAMAQEHLNLHPELFPELRELAAA